ncbi:hypothetical protein AVEN_128053-1 [Araneus ventricosus]|uniref:DUF4371 domain-containing protein n=1 Tax=Araneus ventricosus TaxID=182803 RepID=A0A4Y2A0E3_ARAVE|nr:hypothetical protein AVEN_128053-1 [Araneus ventricosus]
MGCSDKLVAQACDGAAAFVGQYTGMQALIKSSNPESIFVHCYAHVLNLVLLQSISNIRECKIFFSTLSGLAVFFSRSPKRAKFLDEFLQCRLLEFPLHDGISHPGS